MAAAGSNGRAAPTVIGVDVGTQSTKAVAVAADGRVFAQQSRSYQVDRPAPLWAEQWPQVWLDAVVACIRALVDDDQIDPASVAAICVSSLYGGSGIPIDEAGEPTYPCLIWMDRRAQEQVERIRRDVAVGRLESITANGVDSYYGYTKMLWLRDERPEVWQRTRSFLPPNSWINARLCGEVAVDHCSAGNIGGIYDVRSRGWSDEMLDTLGIPRTMMPARLVESTDVGGRLLPAWAGRLGLRAGTPIVAGGIDAAVATLAGGATRPGHHVAMIGTSMCWGTIRPRAESGLGLVTMPNVVDGLNDLYVFGGAITAGASVTWFREQFCHAESAAAAERGVDAHRLLEDAASAVPAGADGLLFLPYLMGERSPIWDPKASGAFVGLGLHHGRAHLYRAVLEGVGHALRHNIDAGSASGAPLDEALTVVGGASHSDLWLQIIADICGRPVRSIDGDVEASLGAAMLAALAVGLTDRERIARDWVRLVDRARPDAAVQGRYERLHRLYLDLYPALKSTMHALRTIQPATGS
ncbi:MAG: FGGY-family carbohydrate kinase [Burkholderiaceae bacterium]